MSRTTRRRFLEESMIATAAAVAANATVPRSRAEAQGPGRASANDTIRHAVIGCRIRGRVHAAEFGRLAGVEVAYVCDPDRDRELVEAASEGDVSEHEHDHEHDHGPGGSLDDRPVHSEPVDLGAGRPLDAVGVADPRPEHLRAAADPQHRPTGGGVRSHRDVQAPRPQPGQVSQGGAGAGQDDQVGVQVARVRDEPDVEPGLEAEGVDVTGVDLLAFARQ